MKAITSKTRYGLFFIKSDIQCITLYVIFIFNVRCQNNSASEDESEVLVDFSSPDFIPFMAKFRSYRRELSDTDKVAYMPNEMDKLSDNTLMKGLIQRMFDYERDRALLETEIFNFPDRMELLFNYINLSFQLFPSVKDTRIITDEAYNTHAKN